MPVHENRRLGNFPIKGRPEMGGNKTADPFCHKRIDGLADLFQDFWGFRGMLLGQIAAAIPEIRQGKKGPLGFGNIVPASGLCRRSIKIDFAQLNPDRFELGQTFRRPCGDQGRHHDQCQNQQDRTDLEQAPHVPILTRILTTKQRGFKTKIFNAKTQRV